MNSLCQWFITTSKSISKQSDSSIIEGLCAESPSSENPPHKMFPQEIETESINLLKMTSNGDEGWEREQNPQLVSCSEQQRRKDQGLLESQVFCEVFIWALKVTFYLGFVWDLQTPPASKGCACITALSSSGWISSNQITGWISFSWFYWRRKVFTVSLRMWWEGKAQDIKGLSETVSPILLPSLLLFNVLQLPQINPLNIFLVGIWRKVGLSKHNPQKNEPAFEFFRWFDLTAIMVGLKYYQFDEGKECWWWKYLLSLN